MKDFVAALRGKTCVVYATYPAREKYDAEGSAYTLYLELKKAGGDAVYAEDEGRLLQTVRPARGGRGRRSGAGRGGYL